ncbi:hypothetical protein SAMN02910447_02156 [Ruminococcus sp. YE71]|uniref:SMI1/KNR4 family protein n=1 Tax=unclassified Ruminococcus TaxID=2608920 RepID=UPI000885EBF3|nr:MULTISPECIES: SMI1/KNR4 family protein [unclassified Ruminococcus]SDA22136.1 hypothetical protein SAMN02910446_02025 [Ruminococcus sp. YE78]SFW37514.1 hypothetical protein SAMN02910447_02156 [Ruminococcus sp. YE71]
MKEILDRLKNVLEKAGLTDRLHSPATEEEISAWETSHGKRLPDEIKDFLRMSNGFEHCWNFNVYPLEKIKVIEGVKGVPDGWLNLGWLIGDGCYIVSDENGRLIRCDCESRPPLSELDLAKWIEDHVIEGIYEDYDIDEE